MESYPEADNALGEQPDEETRAIVARMDVMRRKLRDNYDPSNEDLRDYYIGMEDERSKLRRQAKKPPITALEARPVTLDTDINQQYHHLRSRRPMNRQHWIETVSLPHPERVEEIVESLKTEEAERQAKLQQIAQVMSHYLQKLAIIE